MIVGKIDGVSPNEDIARKTMSRSIALSKEMPLVYLPSHDPESRDRLSNGTVLNA